MKYYLKIIIVWCLIFCINVYADSYDDYIINNYNIDVIVNENNTYDVTETIDVFFKNPSKGITFSKTRDIPLRLSSGETYNKYVQIKFLSVSDGYTYITEKDYATIKPKKNNKLITGEQILIVKYRYIFNKDNFNNKDVLFLYLVEDKFNTIVNNASFKINMPKDFDSSNISFFKNHNQINDVSYQVNERIITGSYSNLDKNEPLTIKIDLENNYLMTSTMRFLNSNLFLIVLFLIGGLGILIWYKFGHNKVNPIFSNKPPKDLNIMEISDIYYGELKIRSSIGSIIDFANKGYLKIEDNNKEYFLIKVKDYNGTDENERILFNSIFGDSKKVSTKVSLKIDSIGTIINNLEKKYPNEKKIVKHNNIIKYLLFAIAFLIPIVIYFTGTVSYNWFDASELKGLFLSLLTVTLFTIISVFALNQVILKENTIIQKIISLMVFFYFSKDVLRYYSFKTYFVCFLLCGLLLILKENIYKKSLEKENQYNKIYGFRKSILSNNTTFIDDMLNSNPNLFYDILPYALALNFDKKWFDIFKNKNIKKTSWFECNNEFNINDFEKAVYSISIDLK